jgi:hypothetical protein
MQPGGQVQAENCQERYRNLDKSWKGRGGMRFERRDEHRKRKNLQRLLPQQVAELGGSRLHQRSIHAARNPGQHVSQARSIDESRGIVIRVTRKAQQRFGAGKREKVPVEHQHCCNYGTTREERTSFRQPRCASLNAAGTLGTGPR